MDSYPSSSSRIEFLSSSSTQEEQIQPDFGVAREKEHMFDKVVTPSDVGKLNRLVIPKQHAEKYFPLDSPSHDDENKIKGGLLLNFEDSQTGKSWRFRYSYWNSSQSYVMTKGWSRFVKEKKLNPGDMVSFLRSSDNNNNNNYTFFIDWRRRRRPENYYNLPSPPPPFDLFRSQHPHFLIPSPSVYVDHFTPNLLNLRRNMLFPYPPHPVNYPPPLLSSSYADYHHHPTVGHQEVHGEEGRAENRVLLEPLPVVHGKRLRLFGVNMDCPNV